MTSVAIIDDDDGIRAALGTLMRSEYHDVSMYISVEEFLASGTAAKPSIIITDIELPGLKGWDLIEILDRRGSNVPIVVITGRSDGCPDVEAARARACCVLKKPFDSSVLCSLVARISAPTRSQRSEGSREE